MTSHDARYGKIKVSEIKKLKTSDSYLTIKDPIVIEQTATIQGNLSFGDASTDTFTCNGLSTFNELIDINQDATNADAVNVDISGNTTGFDINKTATGGGVVVDIDNAGTGTSLDINSTSTGDVDTVLLTQAGTGQALKIDQNNTGDPGIALEIDDEGTGNTNAAVKVASARTGTILEVLSEGAATQGAEIDCADGNTGIGLLIDHNETDGAATGIHIDVASTSTNNAFALRVTGAATNAGVAPTDSISTDCAIDNVKRVIAVKINDEATVYYIPLVDTYV